MNTRKGSVTALVLLVFILILLFIIFALVEGGSIGDGLGDFFGAIVKAGEGVKNLTV